MSKKRKIEQTDYKNTTKKSPLGKDFSSGVICGAIEAKCQTLGHCSGGSFFSDRKLSRIAQAIS